MNYLPTQAHILDVPVTTYIMSNMKSNITTDHTIINMVDTVIHSAACSDNHPLCLGDEIGMSCVNCASMKEQLCDALLELKSARLIIALLQDIGKVNAPGASNTKPS